MKQLFITDIYLRFISSMIPEIPLFIPWTTGQINGEI